MNTVYRSKTGLEILIPIAFLLGATLYLYIANGVWPGIIITSLVTFFITYFCWHVKYIIIDKDLFVKAGFLVNSRIPIQDIKCITRTNNPLSSTALSLDRIQIFYGKSKSLIISPQNRSMFVNQLKEINPNINYLGKN